MKKITRNIVFFFIILSLFVSIIPLVREIEADSQTGGTPYATLTVSPRYSRNLIRQRQYWTYLSNYTGTVNISFTFDSVLPRHEIRYKVGSDYVLQTSNHVTHNLKEYYCLDGFSAVNGNTYYGYFEYDTPVNSNGKWSMYVKNESDSWDDYGVSLDPWWDSSWTYKKQIEINGSQVPSDVTNFPLLIKINNDDDLKNNVTQTDGGDIAFTNGSENFQFNHEIELWDSSTGTLHAWVNVTHINASPNPDTIIYMYYGNVDCDNQWDRNNTWDSNFMAVYHMCNATDSKWNFNLTEVDISYGTTARAGNSSFFDSSLDDAFYHATFLDTFPSELTAECWFRQTATTTGYRRLIFKDNIASKDFYMHNTHDNRIFIYMEGNECGGAGRDTYIGTSLVANTWYYTALTWTAGNHYYGWKNFLEVDNGQNIPQLNYGTNSDFYIGNQPTLTQGMYGYMDEVRISNISRSDAYIETTFNSMYNATSINRFINISGQSDVTGELAPPEDCIAIRLNSLTIQLEWTSLGHNATHTYIERNTIPDWSRESGRFIHLGTGLYHDDSDGLSCDGTIYYYRYWGYNNSNGYYSLSSNTSNNITCVGNPTNIIANWNNSNQLWFTWNKHTTADTTLVIRKSGSFPTSVTDGTTLYNGSDEGYEDSGFSTSDYYGVFSWNKTINDYSSGVQVPWGVIEINVYDENTSNVVNSWTSDNTWGVFVSNKEGTQTYENMTASNPCVISVGDLPYGIDTVFVFNATNYSERIYYMDIAINNQYTLDVYLPPENMTELYLITIKDEDGNAEPNVNVYLMRYINDTEGWKNVTILISDSNGQVMPYLMSNEFHKILLNKSGYQNTIIDFTPSDLLFTYEFVILYETTEFPPHYIESEVISFNASRITTTLTIEYFDSLSLTIDTQIYLYGQNYTNETAYYITSSSATSDSDITLVYTVNQYDDYIVVLFYNHTYFGSQSRTVTVMGTKLSGVVGTRIHDLLGTIVGYNPFGWGNFLLWLLLVAGCYYSDGKHAGEIMTLLGGMFLFINIFAGWSSTLFTVAGGFIPTLFIVIGIIVMWGEHRKKR
jgi:hypothetical protein